jgi:hypothetical protein
MALAAFWVIFSQTHLVTLYIDHATMACLKRFVSTSSVVNSAVPPFTLLGFQTSNLAEYDISMLAYIVYLDCVLFWMLHSTKHKS